MSWLKKRLAGEDLAQMGEALSRRAAKLYPDPVCDICGAAEPVWVFAASRLSTGHETPCWRWCACERCARDLDHENWDAIIRRLTDWLGQRMTDAPAHLRRMVASTALSEFQSWAVRET